MEIVLMERREEIVEILDKIHKKPLIFDGAMGSMLQEAGLKEGELPEVYNIEKPEIVRNIHESYVKAGAQVITTNTFQANELKLKDCLYSVEEIIEAGVKVAKTSGAPVVALDIGPLGKMMKPIGEITFDVAYNIFKRQVEAGVKAGVDCILIETIADLYEAKAAILAAKENSNVPVFCTMTFQEDGRTYLGTDPITAVHVLQSLGVDALGINCSLGPNEMMRILPDFLKYSKVPIMVQSNAGLPKIEEGETVFPTLPEEFSYFGEKMAGLGVSILGGCCGTTPRHIKELKKRVEQVGVSPRKLEKITCSCSATKTVVLDDKTTIIGERINPTGKSGLKAALRSQRFDVILKEAIHQVNHGADILDINVGLPDIQEDVILSQVVSEIQGVVDVPLQIDSGDANAIEKAVRIYNGKPIINSVNGKSEVMENIFPIAKKYGAVVIGLTLDDEGIPETAQERVAIARKIMERAGDYGIPKEDLIIDPLVLTASAQQSMVKETLKALHLIQKELGLKTTLGVSNISFGLPNRELLNRTFLAAALEAGLNAPIMDPLSKEMMDTIYAYRVLNGEDMESEKYIQRFQNQSEKQEQSTGKPQNKDIKSLILNGLKEEVGEEVKKLLKSNDSQEIINTYFIPTLDQVGERYEKGEFFLPQLLRSAEAVKEGLDIIKNHSFGKGEIPIEKKVLLATVKGDIHDIGKNIAKMLLENYGFQVVDMGKDVEPESIVERVKEENISLVGLSALMTTTVKHMETTIKLLQRQVPQCKIMVGGAVLTPEYAQRIGSDFYASDGQSGVGFAREVLGN